MAARFPGSLSICLLLALSLTGALSAQPEPEPQTEEQAPPPAPINVEDLPELRPGDDAYVPGTTARWQAGSELRYTWRLPADYERGQSYDLVLLLHGEGEDYGWGIRAFDHTTFRPDDILICIDGPSEAEDGSRLYVGEMADVYAFRDVLLEITRTFPMRGIFLCGHGQGGFFATYFAGEFPALADGAVVMSAGAWGWARDEGQIQGVPLLFVHAIDDDVVPYRQSPLARDHYASLGHEATRVLRLLAGGHQPDVQAASDGIDWCMGMKLTRPDECLAVAQRLMERTDGPRPLNLAHDLLERIILHADEEPQRHGVPEMDKRVSPETRQAAEALLAEIDAYGAAQAQALASGIDRAPEISLDGSAWLGHVLAVFEDLRGVPSVDAYLKTIDYKDQRRDHIDTATAMYEVWFGDGDVFEGEIYAAASDALPACFLADGLPVEFIDRMRGWREIAAALDVRDDTIEKYEYVELYERGMCDGANAYRAVAASWRAPEPEPEPVPDPVVGESTVADVADTAGEATAMDDEVPEARSPLIWLIPVGVAVLLGIVIVIAARR